MRRRELRPKKATTSGTDVDGRYQPPVSAVHYQVWQARALSNFTVVIAQTAWEAFTEAHLRDSHGAQLAFSDVRFRQGLAFDVRCQA